MSYCEVIVFKDGKPADDARFGNAHGGAACIWGCLYDAYLKDPNKEYDCWLNGDNKVLWALAGRRDLPMFMRAVHAGTFDWAMIKRENLPTFVKHLREFVTWFQLADAARTCHLPAWADFIEQHLDAEAIGFYGMSVSENLWYSWDEVEQNDSIPYDLNTGDKHFEVYDELARVDAEAAKEEAELAAVVARNS